MKKSYLIAIAFALGLVLWMLSGQLGAGGNGADTDETASGSQETKFAVQAKRFIAETRRANLVLRGRTEALRTVSVKAETTGRVTGLPAAEGQLVKEGDLLCELDVRNRDLKVNEARAAVTQRQMEYNAANELSDAGFRSKTQKAAAQAALDAAKADLKAAEIDLANTKITAPFDGILDEYGVEVGDLIQVGNVCGVIVDQDPFLVVTQVSEKEVGLLELGSEAQAKLASGETVMGRIRLIGTRAEPSTRTFRVELEVPNPDGYLRDGVTAELSIPVRNVEAHHISPAFLTLNEEGQLGVRIVDDNDQVRFVPVEIIEDSGDGVWVAGLPSEVTIITVGQEFVVDGQVIDVRVEETDSSDPALRGARTAAAQ